MFFKLEDYSQEEKKLINTLYSSDKTLAENIDDAWGIYQDETKNGKERGIAQLFLIYAFDIQKVENLNNQLIKLMNDRNLHKQDNPEYIPGLAPTHLGLQPKELVLKKTTKTKESDQENIKKLLDEGELLDVNANDKMFDIKYEVAFHEPLVRAAHRIHIHKGKFYKGQELFSTDDYYAHGKMTYAAFTLNANGELSVFNHEGTAKKDMTTHSTMNAGSPVVAAGELVIKDGKLITINTYSGHYQPSLFSIYRTLNYFAEKGVAIADVNIYVCLSTNEHQEILASKIKFQETSIFNVLDGEQQTYYQIKATEFLKIKTELKLALKNIATDIQKYQTRSFKNILFAIKDALLIFSPDKLTEQRKIMSGRLNELVQNTETLLKNQDNESVNTTTLATFITKLKKIQTENNSLSTRHGKEKNSGRLAEKITSWIDKAETVQNLNSDLSKEELISTLKSVY